MVKYSTFPFIAKYIPSSLRSGLNKYFKAQCFKSHYFCLNSFEFYNLLSQIIKCDKNLIRTFASSKLWYKIGMFSNVKKIRYSDFWPRVSRVILST